MPVSTPSLSITNLNNVVTALAVNVGKSTVQDLYVNGTLSGPNGLYISSSALLRINNRATPIVNPLQISAPTPNPLVIGSGLTSNLAKIVSVSNAAETSLLIDTRSSFNGSRNVTISLNMKSANTWIAKQTFTNIEATRIQATSAPMSFRTGALATERMSIATSGEVAISTSVTSPKFIQPNYPFKIQDVSARFNGARTVFPMLVNNATILSMFGTIKTEDIDVTVNGLAIEPYSSEVKYPWVIPYDWFNGYKVSGNNIILFNAPAAGDRAVIKVARTTVVSRTSRYPFSANTVALGE